MKKYYYKKKSLFPRFSLLRIIGGIITCGGLCIVLYIFLPLISWQIYFSPIFASQNITAPIPEGTILSANKLATLLLSKKDSLGKDYTDAQNWFPSYTASNSQQNISSYTLSIPTLHITNAQVSTIDNDLSKHLINFSGTAIPPQKGTAVIFGHSTLPQLYNPKDYKTIFANAYKLKIGQSIIITIDSVTYTYRITSLTVVNPDDTSAFIQQYDTSYLTLVTCTPPGTIWERLLIKSKLEKIV